MVSLAKAARVSLRKHAPALVAIRVGFGWNIQPTTDCYLDLDASAIGLGSDKKVFTEQSFVFYNNLKSPDGSIEHLDCERTRQGEGDRQAIDIDLARLPPEIESIVFSVSIYAAEVRGQNFAPVVDTYVRIIDKGDDQELARFELWDDTSTETAVVLAELYRRDAEWKFRAVGQGYLSGLAGIARDFGVAVRS